MALRNDFFNITSTIIQDNDGEVPKFVSHAVLVVFPAGTDDRAAYSRVPASARTVVTALADFASAGDGAKFEYAIGISYGNVTYGIVGSCERLDFVIIGQVANIAACLCDYGKSGHWLCGGHDHF